MRKRIVEKREKRRETRERETAEKSFGFPLSLFVSRFSTIHILLSALCCLLCLKSAHADVSWTKQPKPANTPGYVGWFTYPYDPVSGQMLLWANDGGIYSTHMRFYSPITNAFTSIPGTGTNMDSCPLDSPTMPGDRHPDGQMAVDTKRNVLWDFGGVQANCNHLLNGDGSPNVTQRDWPAAPTSGPFISGWAGHSLIIDANTYTILTVADASHMTLSAAVSAGSHMYSFPSPDLNPRQDMYYLTLNADPTQDSWHQVIPAHQPTPAQAYASAMVYDADDDVLFAFGNIGNWVYCPTSGTGVLSNAQKTAGCDPATGGHGADDWTKVTPVGNVQPPGSYFPQMVYDTGSHQVIAYGGVQDSNNNINFNQTWAYQMLTHTWVQKALSTTPPPPYNATAAANGGTARSPSMVDEGSTAYNPVTHLVYYHQTTNAGAPADWQYDPSSTMDGLRAVPPLAAAVAL